MTVLSRLLEFAGVTDTSESTTYSYECLNCFTVFETADGREKAACSDCGGEDVRGVASPPTENAPTA